MYDIAALINDLHHEDLRNESHPSLFDENPDYDMLILRIPVIGKGLEIVSIGFILTPKNSFHYNKLTSRFEALGDRFDGPYRLVDPVIDRLLKGFARYQEQIGDMEEALYEDRTDPGFMTEWLGLKRDILRIERVLLRTAETLKEIVEHYEPDPAFPIDNYVDLHEHVDRILRSATLQLGKLDYIYSFYSARTNEKMNRLIFLLTVISGIFLPMNLVVGFFGMNTGGLPFADTASGTLKAISLMLVLLLAFSVALLLWYKRRERETNAE